MDAVDVGTQEKARFTITIVGLGLIGGSMAKALRGFREAKIGGFDTNTETLERAMKSKTIDVAYRNGAAAAAASDLMILCMYPHHIIEFMKGNASAFRKGSILCDVCGTKTHLYREIESLIPENVEYVGIHPMAGREVDGFENADAGLFQNTGMIITPLDHSGPVAIEMMKALATYIGAKTTVCAPALHDEIIAYTSDLMHISATALCMDYHPDMNSIFTAGAFRDCTRIANINPTLWSELFLMNDEFILPPLRTYIEYLERLEKGIKEKDKDELYRLLEQARVNKKEMLTR
ncbi:MAG: prephenate dehydrogenase [Eubacteriales bacterium]|nr:prephenate dehydrogenase [Eubacteriales bacterium]